MEYLEHGLSLFAGFLKLILEGISIFCILMGLIASLQQMWKTTLRSHQLPSSIAFTDFRLKFGAWLLLALEFQLAADIVNTTVAPSFESLGKLGIVALVRTFLNYFLNRELSETINIKQEQLKLASDASEHQS